MEPVAKEFCGNQNNKLILKGIRQISRGCQAWYKCNHSSVRLLAWAE